MTTANVQYPLAIYFDGACRMCTAEMLNVKARDAHDRIELIDCRPADFDVTGMPATQEEMLNMIHAQDAAGNWLKGVDVFVAAYAAVQMPWVSRLLAHPRVKPHAQAAYPWVVRNRHRLSAVGMPTLLNLLGKRARRKAEAALARTQGCKDGYCELDASHKAL